MGSSLQTLARIQKFNIDEQRKILVELQAEEEKFEKALKRINQQYVEEKEFAALHAGVGDFGAFTKRYLQKREELEQSLAELRKQIEVVRDKMAEMFKEQKTYEIVDDNRKKRQEKEEDIKEQKTLDEIGTNSFIKKNRSQK